MAPWRLKVRLNDFMTNRQVLVSLRRNASLSWSVLVETWRLSVFMLQASNVNPPFTTYRHILRICSPFIILFTTIIIFTKNTFIYRHFPFYFWLVCFQSHLIRICLCENAILFKPDIDYAAVSNARVYIRTGMHFGLISMRFKGLTMRLGQISVTIIFILSF